MFSLSKLIMTIGFLLSFHIAYFVYKNKSSFYTEHNTINIQKFPLELLLEALLSFLSVTFGSLYTYANYDEIYISSQRSEKSAKHFNKPLFNVLTSKGGMLNYYLNNKNPN